MCRLNGCRGVRVGANSRWIWCNPLPREHMIEVVLHVENVILDNEPQRRDAPSDHAAILHMLLRNAFDDLREQGIVLIPEIDQSSPLDVPVSMRLDPFVLCVTLAAEFSVDRGQHESDVIVGRRIDQMTQLLLARPGSRPSICPRRRFIGELSKIENFPLNGFSKQERKL